MKFYEDYVAKLPEEQVRKEMVNLLVKYDERGAVMRSSGDTVRSLFMPHISRILKILDSRDTYATEQLSDIRSVLEELNKHTPIGLP